MEKRLHFPCNPELTGVEDVCVPGKQGMSEKNVDL